MAENQQPGSNDGPIIPIEPEGGVPEPKKTPDSKNQRQPKKLEHEFTPTGDFKEVPAKEDSDGIKSAPQEDKGEPKQQESTTPQSDSSTQSPESTPHSTESPQETEAGDPESEDAPSKKDEERSEAAGGESKSPKNDEGTEKEPSSSQPEQEPKESEDGSGSDSEPESLPSKKAEDTDRTPKEDGEEGEDDDEYISGEDLDPTNKDRKFGPTRAQDLAQNYGDKIQGAAKKGGDIADRLGWDKGKDFADNIGKGGERLSKRGADSNQRISDQLDKYRQGTKKGTEAGADAVKSSASAEKTGTGAAEAAQNLKAGQTGADATKAGAKGAKAGGQAAKTGAQAGKAGKAATQGAKAGAGAARGATGGVGGTVSAGADIAAEKAMEKGLIKKKDEKKVRYIVAIINIVFIIIEIILLFVPGVDIIDAIFLILNLIFFTYYIFKHKLWGFIVPGCMLMMLSILPFFVGIIIMLAPFLLMGGLISGEGDVNNTQTGIIAPTSGETTTNPDIFGGGLKSFTKSFFGGNSSATYGTDDGLSDTGTPYPDVTESCSGVVKLEQDENMRYTMTISAPYFHPDAAPSVPQIAQEVRDQLGTQLIISSGFRSPEASDYLRSKYGSKANAGGCSWHNAGLAFDVPKKPYSYAQMNTIKQIAQSYGWEPFNENDCIHFTYKPGGQRLYPSAPDATYAVCGYRVERGKCSRI